MPDFLGSWFFPYVPVRGTVIEIADLFGGIEELKDATRQLQDLIYAA